MADDTANDDTGADTQIVPVCANSSGKYRCLSYVHMQGVGGPAPRFRAHATTPPATSFGALDLQAAYKIDPTRLATSTVPTVAIIDAFGYTNLEADLKVYRAQYSLPACTIANGCLKIVNKNGQTSPLPAQGTTQDDLGWTVETALDVDMISAACPKCNILVVQADDPGDTMEQSVNTAASLGATVISNSWGFPEPQDTTDPTNVSGMAQLETFFNHPGIAVFSAAGDAGYNNTVVPPPAAGQAAAPTGAGYPASSAYSIAVGATKLVKDTTVARGWKETTWAPTPNVPANGAGGSGCSLYAAKPAYQTASPCAKKATADIAAVGDPSSGLAVYNSLAQGWINVGGTSASSPFIAAIWAATGNGAQTSGQFIADNVAKLYDVTSGANGTCGSTTNKLCNAATGWDGPTGFGTPNVSALMPASSNNGSGGGSNNGSNNDGSNGDSNNNGSNNGSPSQDVSGGCAAGGTGSGAGLLLGLALVGLRRRRR